MLRSRRRSIPTGRLTGRRLAVVVAAGVLLTAACAGGGTSDVSAPPPPPLTPASVVTASAQNVTARVGDSVAIVVRVVSADGRAVPGQSVLFTPGPE